MISILIAYLFISKLFYSERVPYLQRIGPKDQIEERCPYQIPARRHHRTKLQMLQLLVPVHKSDGSEQFRGQWVGAEG